MKLIDYWKSKHCSSMEKVALTPQELSSLFKKRVSPFRGDMQDFSNFSEIDAKKLGPAYAFDRGHLLTEEMLNRFKYDVKRRRRVPSNLLKKTLKEISTQEAQAGLSSAGMPKKSIFLEMKNFKNTPQYLPALKELKTLSGYRAFRNIIGLHEADELKAIGGFVNNNLNFNKRPPPFSRGNAQHASSDILLREHNNIASISDPQIREQVANAFRKMRGFTGELGHLDEILPGGYATGKRINRHKRKSIMSSLVNDFDLPMQEMSNPSQKDTFFTHRNKLVQQYKDLGAQYAQSPGGITKHFFPQLHKQNFFGKNLSNLGQADQTILQSSGVVPPNHFQQPSLSGNLSGGIKQIKSNITNLNRKAGGLFGRMGGVFGNFMSGVKNNIGGFLSPLKNSPLSFFKR